MSYDSLIRKNAVPAAAAGAGQTPGRAEPPIRCVAGRKCARLPRLDLIPAVHAEWAMMREIGRIVEAEMKRKHPGEQSSLFGPPTGDPDSPQSDA